MRPPPGITAESGGVREQTLPPSAQSLPSAVVLGGSPGAAPAVSLPQLFPLSVHGGGGELLPPVGVDRNQGSVFGIRWERSAQRVPAAPWPLCSSCLPSPPDAAESPAGSTFGSGTTVVSFVRYVGKV